MFHADLGALPVRSHKGIERSANTYLGAEIDTLGFTHALIILDAGTATGTLDVAVQMADATGGSYAAVNDDDGNAIAFTQVTSANDDQLLLGLLRLDRSQFKRFMKLNAVVATDVVEFGAHVVLLNPDDAARVTGNRTLDFQV